MGQFHHHTPPELSPRCDTTNHNRSVDKLALAWFLLSFTRLLSVVLSVLATLFRLLHAPQLRCRNIVWMSLVEIMTFVAHWALIPSSRATNRRPARSSWIGSTIRIYHIFPDRYRRTLDFLTRTSRPRRMAPRVDMIVCKYLRRVNRCRRWMWSDV